MENTQDPVLNKLQKSQQFLLEQIVKIPEENKVLEEEIRQKSQTLERLNQELDVFEDKRKMLDILTRKKTESELATPMLEASIENMSTTYRENNAEVERLEKTIVELDHIKAQKQAVLEKSLFYYRTILEELGVEKSAESFNLQDLKAKLIRLVSDFGDLKRLRTERATLEQQAKLQESKIKQDRVLFEQKLANLNFTLSRNEKESTDLDRKLTDIEIKQREFDDRQNFYRNKLKYLSHLSEIEELKFEVKTSLTPDDETRLTFSNGSSAFVNFRHMKYEQVKSTHDVIDNLINRKIDLTNKLTRLNDEMNEYREKVHV